MVLAMHSPEVERDRELRNGMSGTERRVWYHLRGKQVAGFKFRRQLPIGPYFADFVCLSARLVVEIDGEFHEEESDRKKTTYIESQGFQVLRFRASDTDQHLGDVIDSIYWKLAEIPTSPRQGLGRRDRT